jgi:hypothetical protein
MYQPIVLKGTSNLVARDSLLFCFCGVCEHQLAWFPQGGGKFKASHCGRVYDAEPLDINLLNYAVLCSDNPAGNVVSIRKKAERMVFA